MSDNAKQIEFWNGPGGQRWAKLQDTLDRNMAAITDALMPFVAPNRGEHVLDIGCGGGTISFLVAKAVGEKGAVTGVDVSAPILAVADARAKTAREKVQFVEADASQFAFKPDYDLIVSRFGVMFFADPTQAFANIRKAQKPGGRLGFVCWRTIIENPGMMAPFAAARDLLPPQEPFDPTAPGPFAFGDPERLQRILAGAGYRNIRIERLDSTMYFGATLDEAADFSTNVGPLSRALTDLPEEVRTAARDRAREALARFVTPRGVTPPAACWLVGATA